MRVDWVQEDINGWLIVKFFICSFALVAISDIPTNWGIAFYGAQGVIALLLIATIFIPVRPALVLLVLLAVAGRDIVTSADLNHIRLVHSTASIWQLRFGPIRPSWIIFGCLIWQFVKFRKKIVPPTIKRASLWFLTVPFITGMVYGGFFTEYANVEAIKDLKFPLILITSTVLFLSLYKKDPHSLALVLSAFIGALLARHLMDLVYLITNYGPVIIPGVSRASVDSAKGGAVFLVFFGVILVWARKRLLIGAMIAIPAVLLLAAYGTRMLWVTFMLGAIVLLSLLGLRRSVFFISVVAVMAVCGVWALFVAHPESADIVLARSKSITTGRAIDRFAVSVDFNRISRIDPTRYAEIVNILDSHKRRYSYLWGVGYGGYYEDLAVNFPINLKSSFPLYSFKSGKFFTAHGFPGQIFLKHGLIGLLYISSIWLIPGYALFKILRNRNMIVAGNPILLHDITLSLVAFLSTAMFQLYWSGKGLFINGVVIAACIEYARRHPNLNLSQMASDTKKVSPYQ